MDTFTQPLTTSLGAALEHLQNAGVQVFRRGYCEGDLLFRQDEPADWLFYIESGFVRVYLLASDGRERTVQLLGPGDLAGDCSFYLRRDQMCYAQAFDGPAMVYQISRPAFDLLLQGRPDLCQTLLQILANTTVTLTEIIEDQSFRALRERVQVALLGIAGSHGTAGPEGVAINMHLTHETIATMVGATRTRVSICLSDLQREGFYRMDNQRIVVSSWAAGLILPP